MGGLEFSWVDTPEAFKSLKIWFELSTMVLTKVATFGVVFGANVLAVEVEADG
jgi:hypothetical protein